MAITGVDAKYVPDGEMVTGSFYYPDLIASPHVTLDDDSQVGCHP
jgi:hypothetical protein